MNSWFPIGFQTLQHVTHMFNHYYEITNSNFLLSPYTSLGISMLGYQWLAFRAFKVLFSYTHYWFVLTINRMRKYSSMTSTKNVKIQVQKIFNVFILFYLVSFASWNLFSFCFYYLFKNILISSQQLFFNVSIFIKLLHCYSDVFSSFLISFISPSFSPIYSSIF